MKVTDTKANVLGVLYTTKKMIHNITANSGKLAVDNEYQVHYNMTNFRLLDDSNFFIDISVPTTVFNYPQEVSGAAIKFELKDVIDMSAKIDPITDIKHKEVLQKFYPMLKSFAEANSFRIEVSKEKFSNIHRHPGGMSSFSGTDYDTNPKNPGICFPFSKGNNTPIFSSIILHKTGSELAHTEYRVANSVGEDLVYYEGDCHTYCKGYMLNLPKIYSFFSNKSNIIESTWFPQPTSAVKELYTIFDSISYEPDTQLVQADNLKKQTYKYNETYGSFGKKAFGTNTTVNPTSDYTSFQYFLDHQEFYKDSVIKTFYGTFLGSDIYDAWQVTSDVANITIPTTIRDYLTDLSAEGILEMYLTEYKDDNTQPTYHKGKLPLLETLIMSEGKYDNIVFKTSYGDYIGEDICDAYFDLEYSLLIHEDYDSMRTIDDFLKLLEEDNMLEMYLDKYEDPTKEPNLFNSYSKYPTSIYGKAAKE